MLMCSVLLFPNSASTCVGDTCGQDDLPSVEDVSDEEWESVFENRTLFFGFNATTIRRGEAVDSIYFEHCKDPSLASFRVRVAPRAPIATPNVLHFPSLTVNCGGKPHLQLNFRIYGFDHEWFDVDDWQYAYQEIRVKYGESCDITIPPWDEDDDSV